MKDDRKKGGEEERWKSAPGDTHEAFPDLQSKQGEY